MIDSDSADDPPRTLDCYEISQKSSFVLYKVEKHPGFYLWFENLARHFDIEDPTGHDFHLYEVKSDQVLTYGRDDQITIVIGEDKIMMLFQQRPDPDVMLDFVNMVDG